jgi:hypothetical protein
LAYINRLREGGAVLKANSRWNRRDLNEPEILRAAEKLGGFWIEGPPLDGWIFHNSTGFVPVEIKQPYRKGRAREFTPAQKRFIALCEVHGATYWVWRTVDDVCRDLGSRRTA